MKLILQTVDKTTFEVEVPDDGTLQDLRNQISAVKNHPVDQLKLIYNGSILNDNAKKLTEYKLVDGTKLVVLLQKAKVETKQSAKPEEPKVPMEQKPVDQTTEPEANQNEQPSQNMVGQFANLVQQDPEAFMQLLMNDPFISQIAQQNPQFFAQVISDPNFINNLVQVEPTEEDTMYEKFFEGEIKLTDDQKKDVNEIVAMGFPFEDVIQYYVAYDNNKEMALNALFNEKFGD
ncbi:ubiquitin family protein [Klosneuvirus KNV1]|uniref:Ubiquitin family protein n=1 Tax=Klosneuvirus KNV1 TaxID=1977640 RepID=A0A1V0SIT3_9VIRU|nr:ubiquitin family protein [Klosneuvirus KNV1]